MAGEELESLHDVQLWKFCLGFGVLTSALGVFCVCMNMFRTPATADDVRASLECEGRMRGLVPVFEAMTAGLLGFV